MRRTTNTENSASLMSELLLAPSFQELQNAVSSNRLTDEQFCVFWRKAAAQAYLRHNRELLNDLLKLLETSPASQTLWGRLFLHQYRGLLLLNEGQFARANQELMTQRQLAWDLADVTELTMANLELANSSLQIFRLEEAEGFLKDAAHWAALSQEPALKVKLLNRQAELAGQQHLIELSLEIAQQALELARTHRLRLEQASALHRIGLCRLQHRDWEGSEQALRESLRLRQTVRDQYGQAELLLSLAELQVQLSQTDKALQSLETAQLIMKQVNNPFGIAQATYLKAQLHLKIGQPDIALSLAIKTAEMRLKQAEPTRLAQSFNLLARIFNQLGQPQQALLTNLKVLDIYQPSFRNPQWVDLLVGAGDFLMRQPGLSEEDRHSYWQKSFEVYRTAIEIIEHNRNLYYMAPVLGRMARALLKLDGFDAIPQATRCYQLQLTLLGDMDSPTLPLEEAIAMRAEALTGLQVCASLQRRLPTQSD